MRLRENGLWDRKEGRGRDREKTDWETENKVEGEREREKTDEETERKLGGRQRENRL